MMGAIVSCGAARSSKIRSTDDKVATTVAADGRVDACEGQERLSPAPGALGDLLDETDTDGDRRITILDAGPIEYLLPLQTGESLYVSGVHELSNLVQELYLARRSGRSSISCERIFEPIVDRLTRLIRERYWASLTRRIDASSLERVISDPKVDERSSNTHENWPKECSPPPAQGLSPEFLYVPHDDERAERYYRSLLPHHPSLVVCRLPETVSPEWVNALSASDRHGSRHGLLSLALEERRAPEKEGETTLQGVPYVVPGGRFNELYGWDSYFHVLGLMQDEKYELARSIVDNQLYEVRHYGQVLNANRTYYLTRSQPPFLSSAVRSMWQHRQRSLVDRAWLEDAVHLLEEEYVRVWTGPQRSTPLCKVRSFNGGSEASTPSTERQVERKVCLSAYHAAGLGEPPEVEEGHFSWLYEERATKWKMDEKTLQSAYHDRKLPQEQLTWLDAFFMQDRSMRESGHDTTYRWTTESGDSCADFATVDLNALLFKYELDLATLAKEAHADDWHKWCERAEIRRDLMRERLFNGQLYVDYHMDRTAAGELLEEGALNQTVSATTFYPLWASAPSPCVDEEGGDLALVSPGPELDAFVASAVSVLEVAGGLAATAFSPELVGVKRKQRQWDYPFGWAPHQILAWTGLRRWGFDHIADRLTYRWLYMIAKNAHDFHGTIPEKYDVVSRSHRVFAEYGNVGTDFSYITEEGFGWMNASFQIGLAQLPAAARDQLRRLVPPSQLDFDR